MADFQLDPQAEKELRAQAEGYAEGVTVWDCQTYSDLHKDAYGVRSSLPIQTRPSQVAGILQTLSDEINRQIEEEKNWGNSDVDLFQIAKKFSPLYGE